MYTRWKKYASVINMGLGYFLLALVYIFIVGIYGLAHKLFTLLRPARTAPISFWREKKYTRPSIESFRRPF